MSKLKILAITARFPPYHLGGYGIRCKDVFDDLIRRGHTILVITSEKEKNPKLSNLRFEYKVIRKLHVRKYDRSIICEMATDFYDLSFLDHQIRYFQPDVIYLGHMIALSRALMPYLAECKKAIVYDEGGLGLVDSWEKKGWWYKFVERNINKNSIKNNIKNLLVNFVSRCSGNRIKNKWIFPKNIQVIFNSELNSKNSFSSGLPITSGNVIHSGIRAEKFNFLFRKQINLPISIIVPGRIEPQKGQLDVVRLLAKMRELGIDGKLILVGEKILDSYYIEIKKEINILQLKDNVTIMPMVEQDKLIELYHQSDICFFPSYQLAGFSRVPLEAMACGCVLFSYGNEGSNEIIINGQTGYIIQPQDYITVISIINKLISNPRIVENVVWNARKEIDDNFVFTKYVDKIEGVIKDTVNSFYHKLSIP